MGNCKYGFNCLFSHSIKRQIVKPEPAKETCRKLYYENYCPAGNKCKFSHDLRQYPCVFNSVGKCMYTDVNCRFSHELKLDNPIICFFNLMDGCKNGQCENRHTVDNVIKYISYEGAFWLFFVSKQRSNYLGFKQVIRIKRGVLPFFYTFLTKIYFNINI